VGFLRRDEHLEIHVIIQPVLGDVLASRIAWLDVRLYGEDMAHERGPGHRRLHLLLGIFLDELGVVRAAVDICPCALAGHVAAQGHVVTCERVGVLRRGLK